MAYGPRVVPGLSGMAMAAALDRCVPGADSQPRSDGRHDGLARAVTVAGTHNAAGAPKRESVV